MKPCVNGFGSEAANLHALDVLVTMERNRGDSIAPNIFRSPNIIDDILEIPKNILENSKILENTGFFLKAVKRSPKQLNHLCICQSAVYAPVARRSILLALS